MKKPIFSIEFENPSEAIVNKLEEIKQLIKEESKIKGTTRWKPGEDEEYWYVDDYGQTCEDRYSGEIRHLMGNVFKTEEECQAWIDRQKAIVRVNDRIDELNDGWEPEWGDSSLYKWEICFDHEQTQFDVTRIGNVQYGYAVKLLKSKESGQQLLEECEADLKLIWGVK